jgi:tetratricopeptide (TPR) repeat protein
MQSSYFENHGIKITIWFSAIVIALSQHVYEAAAQSNLLLKKAQALLEQNQDDAALVWLNTLINKEPNNALAYSERSRVNSKIGNFAKALEDSGKAIVLGPKIALVYVDRSAVYITIKQYQNAIEDSNKAIALDKKEFLPEVVF